MKALLLSAALALAAGANGPQETSEQAVEPSAPPKAPVAGMAGFRSKSRVVLSSDPEQVLQVEAYYVFPDRVRWSVLTEGASAMQRRLYFRFGEAYWSIAPGEADSHPMGSSQSGDSLIQRTDIHMELRRAVMLWPDGLQWEGEGKERSATSTARVGMIFVPDLVPLSLSAQLNESGRPSAMQVHFTMPDGRLIDTEVALRDITWLERGERWWPHTFTLLGYGKSEWRETVESVDPRLDALDHFFLPADRKLDLPRASSVPTRLVRLPPRVVRREPLPEGTRWQAALDKARDLARTEAERLREKGLELEEGIVLELDGNCAPRAVVLRLRSVSGPPPRGWEESPAAEAATARWPGQGPVPALGLDRVLSALPPGATPATPYARLSEGSGGEAVQLVVPFALPR